MTWWQAILLGALQGITEFLPISSSGHLVLAQHYLGFHGGAEAPGAALFFDGVLHLGTLLAVLLYYRNGLVPPSTPQTSCNVAAATKVLPISKLAEAPLVDPPIKDDNEDLVAPASRTWQFDYLRLFLLLVLASVPAGVIVLFRSKRIQESFEHPLPVAVNFLVLGALLLVTDRLLRPGKTTFASTRWWQALLVGCGQAASAYFRGMSRSGTTISMALMVGLDREWAVRFSFLMSIVASLGLGGLGIVKALRDPAATSWLTTEFLAHAVMGAVVSAVIGYLSIAPLIALVRQARLWWFTIYLWFVALLVLWDQW